MNASHSPHLKGPRPCLTEPGKIRNVAVIGHRGTGKTSLVEALLYESSTINRLGSVADQTTITDHDDDERKRGMSISA